MSETDARQTFEEILSLHELDKSDLENSRPTEAVMNELAVKLESWEDCQRLCRQGFQFSDTVIAAIARESMQESVRKIAVMRTWHSRKRSATYLNLAQALYRAEFDDLVEQLCIKLQASDSVGSDDPDCMNQQEINNVVVDENEAYTQSSDADNKLTDTNHKQDGASATADVSEATQASSLSSESSSSLPNGNMLALPENQSPCSTLRFSDTMSEEAYYSFLKEEGLPTKDSEILKKNGFGAKMFVNGFGETEIEKIEFDFTYGGKQLLRRLVKELSQNTDVTIGVLTIKREEILGNGAFGSVFKGTWKQKPCAVKVLHALAQEFMTGLPAATKGKGHEKTQSRFEKECEFMKEYNHPNIVCCYDTLIYPKCNLPILVMELMDTNLCKFIGENPDLALEIQISISRDVAAALTFLHGKDLVHRDLCGDNILLNCRQEVPVAKISDFGMSRVIIKCRSLTHSITAMGRRGFMPPESPKDYDSSLDIFMFGVVMITIAVKVPSVEDKQQRQNCLQEIPSHHPLKHIICQCTSEEKEERPKTAEVYDILMHTKASDSSESESLGFYVDRGSLTKLIGEKVIRSGDLAEVPVSILEKKGSVVGLFFSAHWCPPSRIFTPRLVSWYNNFKRRSNGHLLNIIFISSDADESEFLSYYQMMPWYSLHYSHREKKHELGTKFNVDGIPTLVFVDGKTGKLITREGRGIVDSDPDGNKFPWSPPSFSAVIADCKFIGRGQEQSRSQPNGQIIGFFFSVPWSKHRSIRAFSNELAMVYQKLKESGKKFEIVYVNCDRDETAWKEYVENIPWLALPFGDKHAMDLVSAADVTEIPALIIYDEKGDVITRGGCNSVRSDPLGSAFPWYVNYLTEETADDIPATPSLIWFIPNEMKHTAKEILEQIARRYLSKCAKVKADVDLLFFLSCRSRSDSNIVDYIRGIATLPDIEPLLIMLDVSQRKVHICEGHEVTMDCAKKFVSDYFRKRLVGKGLVQMTVSQRRHIEADVLKSCIEGVSAAMIVAEVDAELFGTLLVQYGFASETALSTSMYSPEIPSELRIAVILQTVESTIREAPSSRKARELFNLLVEVIAEPLGCADVAQNLVTMCSKFVISNGKVYQ